MSKTALTLSGTLQIGSDARPRYKGPYEVVSACGEDTVLDVSGKVCTENITVLEIPYAEVTNPAGGITMTIGG